MNITMNIPTAVTYPSFEEALSIINDATKGRCLVANRAFSVGEIIFVEKSFVFSSANPLPVHECFNYVFKAFKPKELDKIELMTDFLSNLSRVNSVDTARNLLELIAIYRLNQVGDDEISSAQMKQKLALFGQLTAANLDECIDNMKSFRKKFPTVIPAAVTDAAAGALLGILNTNQVELESINGSGLFVQMAVAEHNCSPNSSYSTSGDQLFLTAILPISPGDRVSIDYGNYFYECTAARIESLYHTYSFLCDCETCKVKPDKKRGFLCSVCHSAGGAASASVVGGMGDLVPTLGIIYPHGYQRSANNNTAPPAATVFTSVLVPAAVDATPESLLYQHWECCTCHRVCSEAEVAQFVAYERDVRSYLLSPAATGASCSATSGMSNDDGDGEEEEEDEDEDEEDIGQCVSSIDVLNDIVKGNSAFTAGSAVRMHCAHYILFLALEDLAMSQVDMVNNGYWHVVDGKEQILDDKSKFSLTLQSLQALSLLMEHTLPAVHHEKVIHCDKIAQLYVSSCRVDPSNVQYAKQYFQQAYQMSVVACGQHVPLTRDLLALATNTPTTIEELQTHYQMRTSAGAQFTSFINGGNAGSMDMDM